MQGLKQWCDNCKEVKGLHNNCPNLTNPYIPMPDNTKKEECDVCKSYGGNPPPHVCSSPQPPLSDDWEKEFDQEFHLSYFYKESGKKEIKDFIRQQRLQAQRELMENMIEDFEKPAINDKFIKQLDSIMVKFLKERAQELGLLSNNKE